MERRSHARIPHTLLKDIPVTFFGNAYGSGTLYDLSTRGCKVETRSTPPVGDSLTLRLTLSPETDRVKIDATLAVKTTDGATYQLNPKRSERHGHEGSQSGG